MRATQFKWLIVFFVLCGRTCFAQDVFDCARTGNLWQLKALVALNPDTLNARNAAGFTPLIIACYKHEMETVRFLLNHKVDVNAQSPEGPALLGACYKGDLEMADLLIHHGANVNLVNSQGTSALMYAAMSKNVKLVKHLLEQGANKELFEKSGKKAMDYAQLSNANEIVPLLK